MAGGQPSDRATVWSGDSAAAAAAAANTCAHVRNYP